MAALREMFRPEFLNRIDDIVMFSPLGEDQIERIVELQMQNVTRQLAERQLTIQLTPAARKLLFREGYDPAYGARPMKRAIQRLIQDPLAMKILDGEVHPGDEIVIDADLNRKEMTFELSAPKAAATTVGARTKP
jgi:ATP-dependent Clp protease ATP-binding subunit ClpB